MTRFTSQLQSAVTSPASSSCMQLTLAKQPQYNSALPTGNTTATLYTIQGTRDWYCSSMKIWIEDPYWSKTNSMLLLYFPAYIQFSNFEHQISIFSSQNCNFSSLKRGTSGQRLFRSGDDMGMTNDLRGGQFLSGEETCAPCIHPLCCL